VAAADPTGKAGKKRLHPPRSRQRRHHAVTLGCYRLALAILGSHIPFRPCNPHLNLLLESTFGIVGIKGCRRSFDVGQSVSYIPKG